VEGCPTTPCPDPRLAVDLAIPACLLTWEVRSVARVDVPTDPDAPQVPGDSRDAGDLVRRLAALDDKHPSSARYAAGRDRPMADSDRDARAQDIREADRAPFIRAALADARKAGLATDQQYAVGDRRRVWSGDRVALHDEIILDIYTSAADVPCHGKAVLAGGLPGAGKTTVLAGVARIELSNYLVINPDDVKEALVRRGMAPEVDGLTPMEASDLIHEESSDVAKQLAQRAYGDRKNVVWDVTMKSLESTNQRVTDLRDAGYRDIEGIFVDIPVQLSERRADTRYREAHNEYLLGQGLGGRYVSPEMITGQADKEFGSVNRKVFEQVKAEFNRWRIYDNSVDGRAAVLVSESSGDEDREATG
jgi:predicted kinase